MRSTRQALTLITELGAMNVSALSDTSVHTDVVDLIRIVNAAQGVLLQRLAAFDHRHLAEVDGWHSTRSWLQAFGRYSPYAAAGTHRKALLLQHLPVMGAAARRGEVNTEQLSKVVALAEDVGTDTVTPFDTILTTLAVEGRSEDIGHACRRIQAHANPDGPEPDPEKALARRHLTLSRSGDMVRLRGQLDLEAGATFMTALDALMRPPTPDDPRTAAQRRADALIDMARIPLHHDLLPQVGGNRPQVALLIPPQALLNNTPPHTTDQIPEWITQLAHRNTQTPTTPDPDTPATGTPPTNTGPSGPSPSPVDDPLTAAGVPPLNQGWLSWVGTIATTTAQRLACDSLIYRVIYDPATGQPLDVGRTHRTATHWIRRALNARDRGCRWPGCTAPPPWCDAHHLDWWAADHGDTNTETMLSLCRWHHTRVHEGHWSIHHNTHTGDVTVTRPDGRPYELQPSPSWLHQP
jgi:Domain of unknown function (DUF222)